jgi:YD repeat-containing protein
MTEEPNMSDRAFDGLRGKVHTVRLQTAERRRTSLGARVETKRILSETIAYDEDGHRLEWTFYDDRGQIDRQYRYSYDANGRRSRSVVSDASGSALEECAYEYDDAGRLVRDIITDVRRSSVPYRHERSTVEAGSSKSRTRVDGHPGRSETIVYDGAGRATEMYVYAPDGLLDHRWIYGYDRAGRRTSEISFNADGSFRSKEICKYNEHGDEYKLAVYRPDGSLSMKWAYTYAYDDQRNWIRRVVHIRTPGLGGTRYRAIAAVYRTLVYY